MKKQMLCFWIIFGVMSFSNAEFPDLLDSSNIAPMTFDEDVVSHISYEGNFRAQISYQDDSFAIYNEKSGKRIKFIKDFNKILYSPCGLSCVEGVYENRDLLFITVFNVADEREVADRIVVLVFDVQTEQLSVLHKVNYLPRAQIIKMAFFDGSYLVWSSTDNCSYSMRLYLDSVRRYI